MLVNNNTGIKSLKLITGEELIAEIISKQDGNITIKNPLMMVVTNNVTDTSKNDVVFMRWMITVDPSDEVSILQSNVICIANPVNQAKEKYLEVVGN